VFILNSHVSLSSCRKKQNQEKGIRTIMDNSEEIKEVEDITESTVTEPTSEPSEPTNMYEKQAMTRRQALGRLGFLAGASAIAALSVDDLARLAGREMERRAGDNKVARKVAQEFSNAGMAFAARPSCPAGSTGQGCIACAYYYAAGCRNNQYPGYSNPVECCQNQCSKCCEKKNAQGVSVCGARPDAVVQACQNSCAQIFGSGI
jgi:hypothetical protein